MWLHSKNRLRPFAAASTRAKSLRFCSRQERGYNERRPERCQRQAWK